MTNAASPNPYLKTLYWDQNALISPQEILNITTTPTQKLTELEKHASLSPAPLPTSDKYNQIIYKNITHHANPLAALHLAIKHMTDEGIIFIYFSSTAENPRLIKWREFWISIADRLGLQPTIETSEALTLKKGPNQPRWRLKLAEEQDKEGIKSLFKIAFGTEMTHEEWLWKYTQGRGNAIVAYRNDELVAHYGGLYRRIFFSGTSYWALQPADVMVHPKERGVFTRKGLFFQITATWAEMYGSINFGFPTARSMALGKKLGIYRKAGDLLELSWTPQKVKSYPWSTRKELVKEFTPKLCIEIDKLWNKMRTALPPTAIGFRDHQWIHYRYIAHPTIDYQIYTIRNRWTNNLHGLIVLKKSDKNCELVDIVSEPNKIRHNLSICLHLAAELDCSSLSTWITRDRISYFLFFNPEIYETGIEVPADAWTHSPLTNEIIGKWWLTPGDTDFR